MGIADGLSELGVPALLICATIVIAFASLALHLLFPPSKGKCPIKAVLPVKTSTTDTQSTETKTLE
ncbi:MAG: hypothetical protein HZB51_11120 [Chloroflexi bacterium]|nr:hypothetical protein [Chloroflexota bacterium]